MREIVLSMQSGEPVASSRQIAENFEKRHDHVIRDIDAIKKDVPNFGEMFFETTAPDSYGQSILVGEMAKLLSQNGIQMGQNRLFSWMRENGYLIKDRKRTDYNMPTQKSMELRLFEIKETSIAHSDGHTSINKTPKVTGIGQVYFVNLFLKTEKSRKVEG
jgi:phage antirepressor YoqD-like protein